MEGSSAFIYVEEGMREEESYQRPASLTGMELDEVTHIDETKLPDPPASLSGRASQAASVSVSLDPASKRMVDDLVDSETTEDGHDPDFIEQYTDGTPHGCAAPGYIPSPATGIGDETSYGLIGSVTAREHFGDLQAPLASSPRPLLPSITNSPFALQPGEETPGSRPSTGKQRNKTPSHSQQNSQTRFPLQRQPPPPPNALFSLDSSASSNHPSMTTPDPTALGGAYANNGFYRNQPPLHNAFPSGQSYTTGPKNSVKFGGEPLRAADEPNFLSLEVFEGSTWDGGSDQNGRRAGNVLTPPNGQGAG